MPTHKQKIMARVNHDRVYSASDFNDFNNPPAVHGLLSELAFEGKLVRVRTGVYAKRGSKFDPKYRR